MSQVIIRVSKKRKALEILRNHAANSSHVLIVHYSCESFYDITDGRTPRITSIAVRYYKTAQTKSFSIHKMAERKKVPFDQIEEHYDDLEKDMLTEYFDFVGAHLAYTWIHWNMRDINYGFEAIENRFIVLGGKPVIIDDDKKIDFSRALIDIYGRDYIGHPRLESLLDKNGSTKKDFLTGAQEATAFENKEYVKLHQSTLRKVDIIHSLFEKVADGTLKTDASIFDIYGFSPQGIFELAKDNWIVSLLFGLLGIIIGAVASKWLG